MNAKDAALREGAAILLQVAEMDEHNEVIFKGKWKKGSKAWSGAAIKRLRAEGIAKVREAMLQVPDNELWLHQPKAREDLKRALDQAQHCPDIERLLCEVYEHGIHYGNGMESQWYEAVKRALYRQEP